MTIRNLSALTKTFVFIIPIILVLSFITAAFVQFGNLNRARNTLADVESEIDYLESVFESPELMEKENNDALLLLLNQELGYSSRTSFELFWDYKILLVAPDGSVTDIQAEMLRLKNQALEDGEPEPTDYMIYDAVEGGTYAIHIIENSGFIFNTPDFIEADEYLFPEETVKNSNGKRLAQQSQSDFVSNYLVAANEMSFEKKNLQTQTAAYSYLKISFVLNENLYCSFSPNWSRNNVTCLGVGIYY